MAQATIGETINWRVRGVICALITPARGAGQAIGDLGHPSKI